MGVEKEGEREKVWVLKRNTGLPLPPLLPRPRRCDTNAFPALNTEYIQHPYTYICTQTHTHPYTFSIRTQCRCVSVSELLFASNENHFRKIYWCKMKTAGEFNDNDLNTTKWILKLLMESREKLKENTNLESNAHFHNYYRLKGTTTTN